MFTFILELHCPPKVWKRLEKLGFGQYWHESFLICDNFALIRTTQTTKTYFITVHKQFIHRQNLNFKCNICKLSDLNCVLIGSLYSKLNWQSIVEAIKVR